MTPPADSDTQDGRGSTEESEWTATVEDGKLVINDEIAVTVYLHDPQGEPRPLPDGEEMRIEHPGDGLIDGYPCGIYSKERSDDRPKVTVQLDAAANNSKSDGGQDG